jgi:TRAP-type C4-dicarboxylate transport system permease small subunit
MSLVKRIIAFVTKTVGSAVLILMALQIVIDVLMRNLLGSGFPATVDLVSKYYMILVSFLPIAYSELLRRQVEASIFTDMMPSRLHPMIYAFGFVLSFLVYGLLTWGTMKEALTQTSRGAYVEAGAILFPTWIGYWVLPVCFGLMALVLAMRLFEIATGRFSSVHAEQASLGQSPSQME